MWFAGLGTWLVLALSFSATVFAQTGVGSARGTVTDASGGTVNGAEVTITNLDTAYSRSVTTDTSGNYSFQSIPIGRYTLSVVKDGFRTFSLKDIVLHVNDSLTLDAQLKLGARKETVE